MGDDGRLYVKDDIPPVYRCIWRSRRPLARECATACMHACGPHGTFLHRRSDARPPRREEIAHLASIVTPNQFEAEQLVGQPVRTEGEALRACRALHAKGPATVVRTLPRSQRRSCPQAPRHAACNCKATMHACTLPRASGAHRHACVCPSLGAERVPVPGQAAPLQVLDSARLARCR